MRAYIIFHCLASLQHPEVSRIHLLEPVKMLVAALQPSLSMFWEWAAPSFIVPIWAILQNRTQLIFASFKFI